MVKVEFEDWKRFIEGLRRGDVDPCTERNIVVGNDCHREFLIGDEVVARLCVIDSNTPKESHLCDRIYEISTVVKDIVDYIFIPTIEQWEQWNSEDEGGLSQDPVDRAGEIDPGYLIK